MPATMIADILEEHFEELQFLWPQRRAALRSPRYTMRELGDLEGRIEAHVQGLLVGGMQTRPLLEPVLAEEDADVAFAAAYALLRFEQPALHALVLDALLKKPSEGLVEALCHAPLEPILPQLRSMMGAAPGGLSLPVIAAIAEVLGFQGKLDLKSSQMMALLQHEDATLRRAGWRIALPAGAERGGDRGGLEGRRRRRGRRGVAGLRVVPVCPAVGPLPACRGEANAGAGRRLSAPSWARLASWGTCCNWPAASSSAPCASAPWARSDTPR